MNQEHTTHLLTNYPKLYRQHSLPKEQSCMCWLFECGDGWFDLLDELSAKLETLNLTVLKDFPVEAEQVKEKYGTLRFYVNRYDYGVEELIDAACEKSEKTCETCGCPGRLRGENWFTTRCDQCHEDKQ